MDSDTQMLVVALYDYDGQGDNQLCFDAEDIIEVLAMDDSGWWAGRVLRTGDTGYFPSNFVEEVDMNDQYSNHVSDDGPPRPHRASAHADSYVDSDDNLPSYGHRNYRDNEYDDRDDYIKRNHDRTMGSPPPFKSQESKYKMHRFDDGAPQKHYQREYENREDYYEKPYKSTLKPPMMHEDDYSYERRPANKTDDEGRIHIAEDERIVNMSVQPTMISEPDDNDSVLILDSMKSQMPLRRPNAKSGVELMDPLREQREMLAREQTYMNKRNGPLNLAVLPTKAPEAPVAPTRLGYWSSNMSLLCASAYIAVGFGTLILGIANAGVFGSPTEIICSMYALVFGGALTYYETKWTIWTSTAIPWKAIAYTVGATPLMFTSATYQVSLFMYVVAIVSAIASVRGETYEREPLNVGKYFRRSPKQSTTQPKPLFRRLADNINTLRERNELGRTMFVAFIAFVNVFIAISSLITWMNIVKTLREDGVLITYNAPFAKMFGNLLDLNCGIILLPVCRTFLRYFYDLSTQTQTWSQRLLRTILKVVPLDKALHFHEFLGWSVLVFSGGHTFFHVLNYGTAPDVTVAIFGWWPFISGSLIFLCMLFMYGAVPSGVKNYQFEIFWYSHQLFWLFFILLLTHGAGGVNPNVAKWLAVPGFIYLAERVYRYKSAYRDVALTAASVMDKVLMLEFDRDRAFPNGYKEGQYLYLNCPNVARYEWHPFTISSAPQEKNVSLHIRIMPGNSWTRQVATFMQMLMPPGQNSVCFVTDVQNGKVLGPDGKPLFSIYGPHSAPTQHISEYNVDMIIGSGIGVTPLMATLQSIVHHRWKFSLGKSFPDHAYFYFVMSHKDLDSFRWFIRTVKDADDAIHNFVTTNSEMMGSKSFEFHIFVTSAPDHRTEYEIPSAEGSGAFWGVRGRAQSRAKSRASIMSELSSVAPWKELDLYEALKNPPAQGIRMGNIRVHRGRPDFEPHIRSMRLRFEGESIGVSFCGLSAIRDNLQKLCNKYSDTPTKTFFRLHTENF